MDLVCSEWSRASASLRAASLKKKHKHYREHERPPNDTLCCHRDGAAARALTVWQEAEEEQIALICVQQVHLADVHREHVVDAILIRDITLRMTYYEKLWGILQQGAMFEKITKKNHFVDRER